MINLKQEEIFSAKRYVLRRYSEVKYVVYSLFVPLVAVLAAGIVGIMSKKVPYEKGKVAAPKFILWIGSICMAIFLSVAVFAALGKDKLYFSAFVFEIMSMLGAVLIIAYFNCRISYDNKGFTAKTFFGINRHYSYSDIIGIKYKSHEIILYTKKHKIIIDEFQIGTYDFISYSLKKYREMNDGAELKKVTSKKRDIFNGHIREPASLIFGYVFAFVCFVAFAVIMGVITFRTYSPANTEHFGTALSYCAKEGDDIVMYGGADIYIIEKGGKEIDFSEIKAYCDGKTELNIYAILYNSKDNTPYYDVKAIEKNGEYIVPFEITNEINRKQNIRYFIIFLFFPTLWAIFSTLGLFVLRNPKKYEKFVFLFVSKGNVRF